MTFVPEGEIRAFIAQQGGGAGERPPAEVRDEVRARLAEEKYRKELDEWIDRQEREGRVYLIDLPTK